MERINFFLLTLVFLTVTNCKTPEHQFPLEKRYWDTNDYTEVIRELRFGYDSDEERPNLDNPETRIIVEKLTDEQNYKIVLNDEELGINHRGKVAEDFFIRWKDMTKIYQLTDRQDKYLYDKELLKVWHFGLGLQLIYFELGNEQIKRNADDPNSKFAKDRIQSNVKTVIENFIIYLDKINDEFAFTEAGKVLLAQGIDQYFTQLVNQYPSADYRSMERKIESMSKKTESEKVKSSLLKLKELINSKAIKEN